jgi:hypothetical protein
MTVLRRVLRMFRPVVETLLAGVLVGVVAMGFMGQISGGGDASSGEVSVARTYMLALIHNDLDTMAQLGPSSDTLAQAINFQKRADALKNLKVDALTYLGGSALGAAGVHLYVVATEDQGGEHLIPFTLTVFQGRVVRVE